MRSNQIGGCGGEVRLCWDFGVSAPRSGEDALPLQQAYVSLAKADVAKEH